LGKDLRYLRKKKTPEKNANSFTIKLQKLPPWNFILLYEYLFSDFAAEFLKFSEPFSHTEIYSLPLFTLWLYVVKLLYIVRLFFYVVIERD